MRCTKQERPDPYEYAETLGIRVVHEPLKTANGMWLPEHRMVVLKAGMDPTKDRCTLAHELAHFVLGHEESTPINEWQADRYAATHQIARDEFLHWFPLCGTIEDLAWELQVTPKLALAFAGLIGPPTALRLVA